MRDTHRQFLPLAITLVWLAAGVHAAAAEWFADLYGGAAFTQSSHFSLDGQIDGVAVAGVVDNIRYDTSFSVGARGGYWFESFKFFGLGLDVDHFRPDISSQTATGHGTITDSQDVLFGVPINGSGLGPVKLREVDLYITAFAFDLMFRWPMLAGPNFPMGQLQPYVMAGPALFLQHLEGFDTRNPRRGGGRRSVLGIHTEHRRVQRVSLHLCTGGARLRGDRLQDPPQYPSPARRSLVPLLNAGPAHQGP